MHNNASSAAPAASSAAARSAADTSEADFLRQQSDEARRAIADTLARMQQDLKGSADLTAWTRAYPWPTLGLAAAVGFLTAARLTPATTRRRGRKLATYMDDLLSEDDETSTAARRPKRSAIRSLLSPVLRMFIGALQGSIVAAVTARFQQPPPEASTNGHQPADGGEGG